MQGHNVWGESAGGFEHGIHGVDNIVVYNIMYSDVLCLDSNFPCRVSPRLNKGCNSNVSVQDAVTSIYLYLVRE
jgi:hypothetical protein